MLPMLHQRPSSQRYTRISSSRFHPLPPNNRKPAIILIRQTFAFNNEKEDFTVKKTILPTINILMRRWTFETVLNLTLACIRKKIWRKREKDFTLMHSSSRLGAPCRTNIVQVRSHSFEMAVKFTSVSLLNTCHSSPGSSGITQICK